MQGGMPDADPFERYLGIASTILQVLKRIRCTYIRSGITPDDGPHKRTIAPGQTHE
jgi:hypothetical protein